MGHTINKIIGNVPVAVTVNDNTTAVVTGSGAIYQAGLIGNKIQHTFREVMASENIIGKTVDTEAVENGNYILNAEGSVYEYNYVSGECGPLIREIYSPAACNGDKAVKIVAGRDHVVILTENHHVWGAGDNENYQLVPQGQCRYETATEFLVTDVNLHDNECCNSFVGSYNENTAPIIPQCEENCDTLTCLRDDKCDIVLGYYRIEQGIVTPPGVTGVIEIPIYGDLSYSGYLCVDKYGCGSGSVTYRITRLYIKCGCFISKFTTSDEQGCHVKEFNTSSTSEITIFETDECQIINPCNIPREPITGTSQIHGKCGSCVIVRIPLPNNLQLPTVVYELASKNLRLTLDTQSTSIAALCNTVIVGPVVNAALDFDVELKCCKIKREEKQIELPQPCWTNIYAGFNISVLIDSCNRMYVLGSLHEIRSNKDLLRKSCLEEILNKTHATVSFPADQLNCSRRKQAPCDGYTKRSNEEKFETDISKFGISLSLPGKPDGECEEKTFNVCDLIKTIKQCNDAQYCEPTCEPCDGYIYLNVSGDCGCPCGAPTSSPIGSVTLFNRKSICKLVSQGCPDIVKIPADLSTIVEFDLKKYCIDTGDATLDKIVKLDFCVDGPNVNLYLDIDQPGGIRFTSNDKKCNVEFTVNASTKSQQFILNYGSILDPVELTNLKYALTLNCHYPCPRYKNPFDTKIINTYIRGGDHIRFVVSNPKNIRQAITADIPTLFKLNRKIIDVGVGDNNLSVLVGGSVCPNEIFAIGKNCKGELGIGSTETVVCWKKLNKCVFDCQIVKVYSGRNVTFYITQSYTVYAAGYWKGFINSTVPAVAKSICQTWKIKYITISDTHIVFLGADDCIFGLGDNSVGELGMCHLDCVTKPEPLAFFYKLNNRAARQLSDSLCHPMENKCKRFNKCPSFDYGDNCNRPACDYPYKNEQPCKFEHPKCYPKKYNPNARIHPRYNKY